MPGMWAVVTAAVAMMGVHTPWYGVPGTGRSVSLAVAHPGKAFAIQLCLALPALIALISLVAGSRPARRSVEWGLAPALLAIVIAITGFGQPRGFDLVIGAPLTMLGAFGLVVAYALFLRSLPERVAPT